MILQEDEEWLAHYGVKGMKWGVRKERRASKQRAEKQRRSTMTAAEKRADTNKKKTKKANRILLLGAAARIAILAAPFASQKVNAYKQNARDKKVVSDILERNGMTLLKKKKGVVYDPGRGPKPGTFPNATNFARSMDKNRKMLNA